MTLCMLELARVTASVMWPRAAAIARVYGYHVQALVTTKEHFENGPRDKKVNLEKWLKVNGEMADVLVSEEKGTACSTWYLPNGGRKQRERSLCFSKGRGWQEQCHGQTHLGGPQAVLPGHSRLCQITQGSSWCYSKQRSW